MAGSSGVGLKSLSPSAVRADEHDIARELRGIEAGVVEQLPGGDEAFGPGAGIVEVHIAIGIDRHDELADLDVVEPGLLAECVTRRWHWMI